MKTIACRALVAFTQFVPGYGQVHGDPGSSLKEAKNPDVPESVIQQLADEGRIEAPKGFKVTEGEAAADTTEAP
jgi:hypothetical protein